MVTLPKSTFHKTVVVVAAVAVLGFGLCSVGLLLDDSKLEQHLPGSYTFFGYAGMLVPLSLVVLFCLAIGRLIYNFFQRDRREDQ